MANLSHRQPVGMYLLALSEMCQRFAFWGVANLLVLYLIDAHHFTDLAADQLFGAFTGLAFLLPLLGGYIADRWNYKMPLYLGLLGTGLGCFLIATGMLKCIYFGLLLIAFGGAIFTPSVYAALGALYRKDHHLRESGFSIYYSAVNCGVFLAMIILGAIGHFGHWSLAFILAGLIQILGMWPIKAVFRNPMAFPPASVSIKPAHPAPLHARDRNRIAVIGILALFSTLFWMAYNQGGSSMNLFALRFTDRTLFGYEFPPTWLLSLESLYLVLFAFPLAALYHFLARRKLNPSPPLKAAFSHIAIALCFLLVAFASRSIPQGSTHGSVSPYYLVSAYALMALGEMLIMPIGLSLVTHLSPHRFTALLVGLWYFSIGLGFYLGGAMAPLMSTLSSLSSFFGIFVVISLSAGGLLLFLVKKLNRMRHIESL